MYELSVCIIFGSVFDVAMMNEWYNFQEDETTAAVAILFDTHTEGVFLQSGDPFK